MPLGAGKYDAECALARISTNADGVVLIVLGGVKGHGFSMQAPPEAVARLPDMLEAVAREIRALHGSGEV